MVVLGRGLAPGHTLGPREIAAALQVRKVPVRFVPPGTLGSPGDALGLAPVSPMPAGSYLVASQLRAPRPRKSPARRLGGHRRPVEISVSGSESLLATGSAASGAMVDVVVTTEPSGPGPGRTYIAATEVPLLALDSTGESPGPGGASVATLGLTKRQALRLIAAESFARRLTLLPEG